MIASNTRSNSPSDNDPSRVQASASHALDREPAQEDAVHLDLALKSGRVGRWRLEFANRLLLSSDTCKTNFGLDPGEELSYDRLFSLIHPEDRPLVMEAISASMSLGDDYRKEYRVIWPEGSIHWILAQGRVIYDSEGSAVRMLGITVDITDVKEAEEVQRFLERASRILLQSHELDEMLGRLVELAVPYVADWCVVDIVDPDGRLRRAHVAHRDPARSELAGELYNFPVHRNPGSPVARVFRSGAPEIFSGGDPHLEAMQFTAEHRRVLTDLGIHSYICVPVRTPKQIHGVISFVLSEGWRRYHARDIRLAEDLASRVALAVENARLFERTQQMARSREDFVATLAHELRGPLGAARTALDVLENPGATTEQRARQRALVRRQVEQMTRLVEDLLDLSRDIHGALSLRPERVELVALVEAAVEIAGPPIQRRKQSLEVDIPAKPVVFACDPLRLRQVLVNLLDNASKYTPLGGAIELRAVVLKEGDAEILELSVKDNGIGLRPSAIEQLFEPFSRADRLSSAGREGLGLGLAIVRRLVELHGGAVTAQSDGPGKGTLFTVRLPIRPGLLVQV